MEAAMIYEFVVEGLGIGIDVDIHSKNSISDNVKLIPIENGVPWIVYMVYKEDKATSPYIKQFLDTIKE